MDPAKMKVVDLRAELGALGLETKGNKPALVERLKKALEAKTGNAVADTTILDTSTEEGDEPPTPRRSAAARTTRRSSSSRVQSTPAKQPRLENEAIEEELPPNEPDHEEPMLEEKVPQGVPAPQPVAAPEIESSPEPEPAPRSPVQKPNQDDVYCLEDSQSPVTVEDDQDRKNNEMEADQPAQPAPKTADKAEKTQAEADSTADDIKMEQDGQSEDEKPPRELTEEEEWEQLNERLKIKEQERIEREKKQAEDDARKLEELSDDPVKLNRLKRKFEKKQRWSNFYRAVEVTNEVLTPPTEEDIFRGKGKKKKDHGQELKVRIEPELDDSKMTLSWYDSDLNQFLELPELNSVVPLSESAFAQAWAGVRASHGVTEGRVCYEVRVGAVAATNEASEKEAVSTGLRIGWSTQDQSLHLGDGETSWAFESSGRAVNNSEFKEYAKKVDEKDVVGVYLDLESQPCTISYTINGEEQGVAYEFEKEALGGKAIFPHILTKNIYYRVNFGNDRYTMMTRTKIVRNTIEIPVEQVLEEKRKREEELLKIKEEAEKLEREKREKDKLEREIRLKKKKEDKEKAEQEKKEKERQERLERGEPEPEEPAKDEAEKTQENGDNADDETVKKEPAEANSEAKPDDKEAEAKKEEKKEGEEVKEEPVPEEGDPEEVTEEQVLAPGHVLDKRIKFVTRYTVEEELAGEEARMLDGYIFIAHGNLTDGPSRPATLAECEVLLMVGMPGAGKTYWVHQHVAAHPEKRYNIISTGALFDQMKVDCKPLRPSYEGRWDAMVSKCAKCVLKLFEIARGRRRNYILDQTNVYPSAQRRKLREFEGYRRVAVVVVPSEEIYLERRAKREANDGKEVPDPAVVDMKANFTLPEKGVFLDDVIYAELNKEEAEKVLEAFHKEAKAAGVVKEKERKDRSESRDVSSSGRKRQRSNERRRDDRRTSSSRDGRDREDRRGGGGGGRWGPAGPGGRGGGGGPGGPPGRWGGGGGRDRGPPQGGRFDRWGSGGNRDFGGRDGGGRRDSGRDGFRGGRGPSGPGGPGGPGGPPRPNQGPPGRFDRDRNNGGGPGGVVSGGIGGGVGGWQRGGQPVQRGGVNNRMAPGGNRPMPNKDNPNQQNQQGWNQWAGGWGGWGGWNQNQGWGNWGNNWGNWNQQQQGNTPSSGAQSAAGAGTGTGNAVSNKNPAQGGQANQNQWGNYTAQQWYQWQQWQQQQQGWPGYQQQQQQGNQQQQVSANPQADAQAWAQYYQNYGNAAANPALAQNADKK